jgi:hypothetical protein
MLMGEPHEMLRAFVIFKFKSSCKIRPQFGEYSFFCFNLLWISYFQIGFHLIDTFNLLKLVELSNASWQANQLIVVQSEHIF